MIEVVVKKLFIMAAHLKCNRIASDVKNTRIESKFTGSIGCFAEEMNNTIDLLNSVFYDIGNKLEETNISIKHIVDDFSAMDAAIAVSFETAELPKE